MLAGVLLLAALIAYAFDEDTQGCGCFLGVLFLVAGLLTGLLGVGRFVKWTWAG